MSVRCDLCGLESTAVEAFRTPPISGTKSQLCCPSCWNKKYAKYLQDRLVAAAVAAVAGLFILRYLREFQGLAWYGLAFGLFVLVEMVCVVPHELGHAVAALLVNMRLFNISIGSLGRVVGAVRILGCDVVIRSIPFGGSALVAPKSKRFVRLRHVFVSLCGPLANVLLMLVGIWLLFSLDPNGVPYWACMVFVGTNAFILVCALYPRKVVCGEQLVPNDGLALLTTPFMSQQMVDECYLAWHLLEGLESRERHRYEDAKRWFDRAVALAPDSFAAIDALGIGLLDLGQYDEARKLFADLLQGQDDQPDYQAACFNNLAWADFLIGEDGLLPEAMQFSEKAMARFPWTPQFKGTRGSILVWAGELDEGVRLLSEAFQENYSPDDRACNASMLALAMLKKGHHQQAERYLKIARKLHSTCPLLERVEREMAGTVVV
ncbi:MAG TPA: tetratricopeptide repeat protein [Pirellulales bacterium]|jgi:hypothetical protein|nr:tetratricopeptide repeat protein [Pirellulales bacterium]